MLIELEKNPNLGEASIDALKRPLLDTLAPNQVPKL